MPSILTRGATTVTPIALSDYTSDQEGGTILHPILGRTNPDVTHRPAGMRTGSFALSFATEAASNTARVALAEAGGWQLTSAERPTVNMRFIVRRVSRPILLTGEWQVTVGYEEIGT